MSKKEKIKVEESTAEELVEVTGEEKKHVIIAWVKEHPWKTVIGLLTGTFVIILAGYGLYKLINGRLYKVVTEEEVTEDDFEDKTSENV